jgi:hypothetical protein
MEPENITVWIPFLAIPLGIGMIVTLMVLMHRAKIRELDQRHRERMAAIEKGLDPSYGAGTDAADTPRAAAPWVYDKSQPRYLLRGLVWLGVGLAFVFSAGTEAGTWAALPGWTAAAVGGAYVVYYVMEGRRSAPPAPPERPRDRDHDHAP